MSNNISQIHDKYFKSIMKDRQLAIDFFKLFLPASVLDRVQINTLSLTNNSFINDELKETFADILFKVKLANTEKECFITILLEHKSYIDKNSSVQLLFYLASAYYQQSKSGENLEFIVPFLFYHGPKHWTYKPLQQLFKNLPQSLQPYIPVFETIFVDLSKVSEEELKTLDNFFLSGILLFQKYQKKETLLIQKISFIFELLEKKAGRNKMYKFLVYFSNTVDIPKGKLKQFIDRIPQSIKPRFMSIYESILKEGLKKGLKKGIKEGEKKGIEKGVDLGVEKNRIKVIIKGYENNVPLDTLAMLTELSVEHVKKIIEAHLQGKTQ